MGLNSIYAQGTGLILAACLLAAPMAGCGRNDKSTSRAARAPQAGQVFQAPQNPRASQPGKTQVETTTSIPVADIGELPQGTPGIYKGNLTPGKAAEITNAVAKLSLAEIPTKDLPKDPKMMMDINERIRQKSDALYARYGTTMSDVMRYISDLSPKDREAYNNKLTELFLQESKKKVATESAARR